MDVVLSGIQPSGELHFGNYLGAIHNWTVLQEQYRCFFSVVDYHAITQDLEPEVLRRRTVEMAIDLIACGVNPEKAVLFLQSRVPEHTELCWVLSTVTPFGELARMTQYKDKSARQEDNINVGLFTYPVLQAADIVLYKASFVPVGADQVQHLELAREIVRKFNARWGDVFPEPRPLLTRTPKILGLDGQAKMSKSLNNTITLGESDEAIAAKLKTAATDPRRARRKDPGNPDDCNIATLHRFFSDEERLKWVVEGCTTAGIGCLECKTALAGNVSQHLAPIRERKAELAAHPERILEILREGTQRARAVAVETMRQVRDAVGLLT